jgi:hypothetical protein
MNDGETQNWVDIEEHLYACERAYSDMLPNDQYCLNFVIRPLRDRYASGERSRALAEEIMAVSL